MLTLRPYQEDALAAIDAALARDIRRQLISSPTGTGKTVLFAELIRRRLPRRALVLVHRDELIRQAVEKLRQLTPRLPIGIIKAEQDEGAALVIVASVQTLSRTNRLHRLVPDFGTVVVDEAHHAAADSYQRILEHVRAFEPHGPLVVGVTATPYRADGAALVGDLFQELVYERGLLEMIRAQYLADLRAVQVHLAVDFNALHVRAGDFATGEVDALLYQADAPDHVADAITTHAADRKTLVFAPTVTLAHDMAAACSARGLTAEALDGETPLEPRRAILQRFTTGAIQVVANCGVLTEGFDEPSITCIAVARPTRSKTLYVQMIGRGTRRFPGKQDCLILDVVGASTRHDLMTTGSLFGVTPADLDAHTLTVAVAHEETRRRARQDAEALAGRLVAQTVELFAKRELRWLTVGPTHFVLSAGPSGMLHLRSRGSGWSVALVQKDGIRQTLREGLSLEYAQGVAEDHVRQAGAESLVSQGAAWRLAPASVKQLTVMQRMRMGPAPGLTRGEASDLIAKRVASQANFIRKKISPKP